MVSWWIHSWLLLPFQETWCSNRIPLNVIILRAMTRLYLEKIAFRIHVCCNEFKKKMLTTIIITIHVIHSFHGIYFGCYKVPAGKFCWLTITLLYIHYMARHWLLILQRLDLKYKNILNMTARRALVVILLFFILTQRI